MYCAIIYPMMCTPALSQVPSQIPVIEVRPDTYSVNLTKHIVYNIDHDSILTIEQILHKSGHLPFTPIKKDNINLGFGLSTLWTGFTLTNSTKVPIELILEVGFPLIDTVNLYHIHSDNSYSVLHSGELAGSLKTYMDSLYRNPIFKVVLPANTHQLFYLSVHDKGSVPFSLHAMSQHAFDLHKLKDNAIFAGYFSLFIIILLYNSIVFVILKTRTHFYYVLYLMCMVLWQSAYSGHASLYLWNRLPFLTNHAIPFLISSTAVCAILFSKNFLKTSLYIPKTNKILTILSACFCLTIILSFLPNYTIAVIIAAFLAIVFTFLILGVGIISWLNGYKPARYFTIAWFFLLAGTIVLALKSFGLIPSTFITEYGQYFGSLAEIFLLSLALVDMVELLKKDKEEALLDAFNIEIEANEKLELKVAERTVDLTTANKHLATLSNKLSKYLSPQVYNSIFTGQTEATNISSRKPLTVFFSDIAGFTQLTDSIEPEELSRILNEYLTEMANIALEYGGTIDKFIGDSIMVFFGDPETKGVTEDALLCAKMAIAMREKNSTFHLRFPQTFKQPLNVRMGIHSGYCTVGSFGAENRLEYTIIGSTVNVASRLEGLSALGGILVSSATHAHIKSDILCTKHKTVKVKGINAPVDTYLIDSCYKTTKNSGNNIYLSGKGYSVQININELPGSKKTDLILALRQTIGTLQD